MIVDGLVKRSERRLRARRKLRLTGTVAQKKPQCDRHAPEPCPASRATSLDRATSCRARCDADAALSMGGGQRRRGQSVWAQHQRKGVCGGGCAGSASGRCCVHARPHALGQESQANADDEAPVRCAVEPSPRVVVASRRFFSLLPGRVRVVVAKRRAASVCARKAERPRGAPGQRRMRPGRPDTHTHSGRQKLGAGVLTHQRTRQVRDCAPGGMRTDTQTVRAAARETKGRPQGGGGGRTGGRAPHGADVQTLPDGAHRLASGRHARCGPVQSSRGGAPDPAPAHRAPVRG